MPIKSKSFKFLIPIAIMIALFTIITAAAYLAHRSMECDCVMWNWLDNVFK